MSINQAPLLNSAKTSLIWPAGVMVKVSMPLTSATPDPIPWATQRQAILSQLKKISSVVKVGMGG